MMAYLVTPQQEYDAQQARAAVQGMEITADPVNIYQAEIEEFSHAILEGHPTTIGGEVGLRSQKILTACYESAKSGNATEVL